MTTRPGVAVLAPDAVWRAGGVVVTAALMPVMGAERVARLAQGQVERWFEA
ncbi:hypothetical protein [Nonomuraea sp. NPDC049709]|uniref:hypothetical protein n=1 Tax=Nonomuraea sp. NPDC049709 TaxID=3154736 RepID=UPI003449558F